MTLSVYSHNFIKMPVSPIQILMLIQLDEGPKYGYEMLKKIKDEFKGTWEPKTGTVYPALKSLEKKGYIKTETRDETDYYIITKEGKQLFDLMLLHLDDLTDFSIKYMSVVFNWLSIERKQSALDLMDKLTQKEEFLSQELLKAFIENIDTDIRQPFLSSIKKISQRRIRIIDSLMEN